MCIFMAWFSDFCLISWELSVFGSVSLLDKAYYVTLCMIR